MDDVVTLTARELERFMHVVHSSMEVRRRNQFFLWSQGHLQSLVPHEVLICAHGDHARRSLVIEHFSSYPLPGPDVESILNVDGGLMVQAIRAWVERGERPLLVCGSDRDSAVYRRFEAALFRHAFPNFAMHGLPVLTGAPGTFFMFVNLPQPLTARQGYLIEILTPYIHCAFVRMLANERQEQYEMVPNDRLITAREIEILQWVRDGKSNQEIGHILGISPLTVKNHVQKILKKLNVQNRAQAVARGLSLQIIKNVAG
ncbi:MAG: transcriptional regulator EpsA [Burkholderiales bacterium]|nr:transcriptional regulator EpsA [Burkholderiales bacterium]